MFAKVFTSILDSSLAKNWQHRMVFQDLLLLADSNGWVAMDAETVAHRSRLPLEMVESAIAALQQPDPQSKNKEHDGRRIIDASAERGVGWFIVSHAKYRAIRNEVTRQQQLRENSAAYRQRKRHQNDDASSPSSPSSQAEAEAETEAEANTPPLATLAERIYAEYPKKVGKPAALRSISKALKSTSFEELLDATKAYAKAREGCDSQFTPMPATWFNQQRYNDEPSTWTPSSPLKPTYQKEAKSRRENLTLTVFQLPKAAAQQNQ